MIKKLPRPTTHLPRWLGLLAIMLIAIFLRFWQLTKLPPGFHLDEAYEGLEAWRILTEPGYHPIFLAGNVGVPPLNAYANALMFGLFRFFGGEVGPVAMRSTAACFGLFGVLALYGLADELQKLDSKKHLSLTFPLFAAASLAVMRWHVHFSRLGIEPILTPLLWAGATWLLLRGWRTGSWLSFASSGVLIAATMYAYQGAWVIPLLMIPVVLLLLWQWATINKKRLSTLNRQMLGAALQTRPVQGLIVTVLVTLLVFAPLGYFLGRHWDLVVLRPTQITLTGEGADAARDSFWLNVEKTAKMFGPFGAPGDREPRRNIPGAPALNFWLALPFYLGMGLAIGRLRRPSFAIILIGLVGMLLPGVFSTHAPHFHRILGAVAPTALLCAIGLDWLWRWRPRSVVSSQWSAVSGQLVRWSSVLLIGAGGITGAQEYFVRWANLPMLDREMGVGVWAIGQEIMRQSPTTPIYVTPHAAMHPTLVFALQTVHTSTPVTFDGSHIFPLTAQVSTQPEFYLVFEGEDKRTRLLLADIFPTAVIEHEERSEDGQVKARLYKRLANAIPQRPPQHPLPITLGDGIALLGYDVQPAQVRAGKLLYLQLHWQVYAPPAANWTVFTHVLRQDRRRNLHVVAGYDSQPGAGSLPTTRWLPGWRVLDEYQIQLPADLTPGEYALEIGLYQATGEHLPSTGTGVRLGVVEVER